MWFTKLCLVVAQGRMNEALSEIRTRLQKSACQAFLTIALQWDTRQA